MRSKWVIAILVIGILLTVVVGVGQEMRSRAENERYIEAACQALGALQDVQSLVKVGITYGEYHRRIGDARIAVDRFLRAYPIDLAPPSREHIEAGMEAFEEAANAWESKISTSGGKLAEEMMEDVMQIWWRQADEAIAAAEAALSPADGASIR